MLYWYSLKCHDIRGMNLRIGSLNLLSQSNLSHLLRCSSDIWPQNEIRVGLASLGDELLSVSWGEVEIIIPPIAPLLHKSTQSIFDIGNEINELHTRDSVLMRDYAIETTVHMLIRIPRAWKPLKSQNGICIMNSLC